MNGSLFCTAELAQHCKSTTLKKQTWKLFLDVYARVQGEGEGGKAIQADGTARAVAQGARLARSGREQPAGGALAEA